MFRCCLGRGVILLTGDRRLVVDGLSPGDDKPRCSNVSYYRNMRALLRK